MARILRADDTNVSSARAPADTFIRRDNPTMSEEQPTSSVGKMRDRRVTP